MWKCYLLRLGQTSTFVQSHQNLHCSLKQYREQQEASDKEPEIWATSWETLFMPYVNNKGTDLPVQSDQHICCSLPR